MAVLSLFNAKKLLKSNFFLKLFFLGKQRFAHAAAFFLLSGSLKDALDICIDKLDDLQLAMVISRLYDGEINAVPESTAKLLHKHVLGSTLADGTDSELEKAHPDPFLR